MVRVVDGCEAEDVHGAAVAVGHRDHEREEEVRHPDVGAVVLGTTQGRLPHAERGRLGFVGRRSGKSRAHTCSVRGPFPLGQHCLDHGPVQDRCVNRIDPALEPLEPVRGDDRDGVHRLQAVLVVEGEVRERRCLAAAQPHPCDPAGFVHREMDDLHRGAELVVSHQLGRGFDDAARHIELPTVVDATQAVSLDTREDERRAAVRTELVEESDAAVRRAEGDVVLTEQPHGRRGLTRHEVLRQCERDPVVLPHQPTQRGITLDSGHEVVLGTSHHGASLDPQGVARA